MSYARTAVIIASVMLSSLVVALVCSDRRQQATVDFQPAAVTWAPVTQMASVAESKYNRGLVLTPEETALSDTTFEVVVRTASSEPVIGARVALCSSAPGLSGEWGNSNGTVTAVTNGVGVARFESLNSGLDFIVVYESQRGCLGAARVTNVSLQEVRFGPDILAGIVAFNGKPPARPGRLTVRGNCETWTQWPPTAQASLREMGAVYDRREILFNSTGHFSIAGLQPGSPLYIEAPVGYWISDDSSGAVSDDLVVTPVALDVMLDLVSRPSLNGAIHGDGDPIGMGVGSAFQLECVQLLALGHQRTTSFAVQLGDFAVPFIESRIESFAITIRKDKHVLARIEEVGPFIRSVDVGAIQLASGDSPMAIEVEDSLGLRVSGARALIDGEVLGPSGPDGVIRASARQSQTHILVGAPGMRAQRIAIGSPVPARISVRLHAANALRWRMVHADPTEVLDGVYVTLEGPTLADYVYTHGTSAFDQMRGATSSSGGGSQSKRLQRLDVPESQVVERTDIPADVLLMWEVCDQWEHRIDGGQIVLAHTGSVEIAVRVPPPAPPIAFRVVDEQGVPIPRAMVDGGRLPGPQISTDDGGRCVLTGMVSYSVSVFISADGYETIERSVDQIALESQVVLRRSRPAWVTVTDTNHALTDADVYIVENGRETARAARIKRGLYRFSAVPRVACELTIAPNGARAIACVLPAAEDHMLVVVSR